MTLSTLIAPHCEKSFLSEIVGRSAFYVEGAPDKYGALFSWRVLNHLLEFGGLRFPRLRLIKGDQLLPESTYLRTGTSGYPRPVVGEVTSALGDGATLAIDSVEELHEPVDGLCQVLEHTLGLPVQADIYANCRESPIGSLHWNDREMIVLEIEGSKIWRLYCPTALNSTVFKPPPEPTGDPAWVGTVKAGDLLYIPKGWWFCVETPKEPSIFLALRFRCFTAIDVARRLLEQLEAIDQVRTCYPHFAGLSQQSAFLGIVQGELLQAIERPGLLLGFLHDMRTFADPRVHFNLPWGLGTHPFPASDEFLVVPLVRFPRADAVAHGGENGAVRLFFNGRFIEFNSDVGRILECVCDGAAPSLRDLLARCASEIPRERALDSLAELARHGIVGLKLNTSDCDPRER